jgi:hypothetical protein
MTQHSCVQPAWNRLQMTLASTMITLRDLAARHWRAFSLDIYLEDQPLPASYSISLYAVHLLGLLAIVRLTHQPLWLALIPLLLVQPLAISLRLKRGFWLSESLAPLFIAYTVLGLRVLIATVAHLQGLTTGSLVVPPPWGDMFNLNLATGVCGVWALMAQAGPTTEAFGRRGHWTRILGSALALVTLTWAAIAYLTVRTHGVTGSDPYAYVQMAVDIADHGTALHTFPLAPLLAGWDLPVWPVVPVGYVPPDPNTGLAATVWSPGYSAALALGYCVADETAMYVLTPLLGLAALVTMWWLCLEVLHSWQNDRRYLAAGISVFILATSYEQVDRLSVPMADIPAQLFTMLTVIFALRATRGRTVLYATLTGMCLGIAFALRYTQVLMALCVLLVWVVHFFRVRPAPRRTILLATACFGGAGWLVAFPVLWYHQVAFGGPFQVGGTAELALFGLKHIPTTLFRVTQHFASPKEFLYLGPFVIWGMIQTWKNARRGAVALFAWLAVIVMFHLPYAALRMRDLLSVLPVLAIWTGVGMATALSPLQPVRPPARRTASQVLVTALMIAALWTRSQVILWLPVHAQDFQSFGYLRADQRAAFDALADLTHPSGIVATSLNGGAISLYAKRDIVRPAYWSQEEWLSFADRAVSEKRQVYLLVDGQEMQDPLQVIGARFQLRQLASLPLPYFYLGGNPENREVPLYEVIRATTN